MNFSTNSSFTCSSQKPQKVAVKILRSPSQNSNNSTNKAYQTQQQQQNFNVYQTDFHYQQQQQKALMPPLDHATHIISHQHHCKHHHKHQPPLQHYVEQQHFYINQQQPEQHEQQLQQHQQKHQQHHKQHHRQHSQQQQLQQAVDYLYQHQPSTPPPQYEFQYQEYFLGYDKKPTTPCKTSQSQPQTPKHCLVTAAGITATTPTAKKSLKQRQISSPCCLSTASNPTNSMTKEKPPKSNTTTPTSSLRKPKKWRRPFSSYHSCDDLDAANMKSPSAGGGGGGSIADRTSNRKSSSASMHSNNHNNQNHQSNEKMVMASLKYLCACTGATLRNLSKKTKDLHKNNCYSYVKPTWRVWGEEKDKDIIYTVYLKKVCYHRPTPSATNPDSEDDISYLEWEMVRVRFVKAATLERLVEALATDDGELESTFINVFLNTYRTFSTPKEVVSLFIKRYHALCEKQRADDLKNNDNEEYDRSASIHEQHKKTLVSVWKMWLNGFPEDWTEDNLRHLIAFTSKCLPSSDLHTRALNQLEMILRQQIYSKTNMSPWLSDQFAGLYLAPEFQRRTCFLETYRFPRIDVRHFAEQLTRMDCDLFKKVISHQCLGATWSRRAQGCCETVVATVKQFNEVLYRVITSILIERALESQERAFYISVWIDIAQELRLLKNFSSLKAIISGLNSSAIYRLSKIWSVLPKEKMEIFDELARICSEENNASVQRELLIREGTAKFAETVGENDRHLQKIIQKQSTQTSHGTIPYLGTFLTDLTMIHQANHDTVGEDNLINFEKKRKEFEVLAQIKLLQGAANTYNLDEDPLFNRWFYSMPVLSEEDAHTLSYQLEAPPPTQPRKSNTSSNMSSVNSSILGHRKTDSIASNSSSGAGSQFYCEISSHNSSRHNSLDREAQNNHNHMSATSSVSNLSLDSSNSGGGINKSKMIHSHSSNGLLRSTGGGGGGTASGSQTPTGIGSPHINAQVVNSPGANADFYIVKITLETDTVPQDGIVVYKSMMVKNNERTPQVIRNALMKLGIEDDADNYTLAQRLPDKDVELPRNANVFYAVAVNKNFELRFILKPSAAAEKSLNGSGIGGGGSGSRSSRGSAS